MFYAKCCSFPFFCSLCALCFSFAITRRIILLLTGSLNEIKGCMVCSILGNVEENFTLPRKLFESAFSALISAFVETFHSGLEAMTRSGFWLFDYKPLNLR